MQGCHGQWPKHADPNMQPSGSGREKKATRSREGVHTAPPSPRPPGRQPNTKLRLVAKKQGWSRSRVAPRARECIGGTVWFRLPPPRGFISGIAGPESTGEWAGCRGCACVAALWGCVGVKWRLGSCAPCGLQQWCVRCGQLMIYDFIFGGAKMKK